MKPILNSFVFCLAVLLCPVSPASALELTGDFVQGGMVVGKTDPTARIFFDGDPVRVSPDGIFVIGFGRDAPRTGLLEKRTGSGDGIHKPLLIEKRDYQIERINGLPPRKVEPSPSDQKRIRKEVAMVKQARSWDAPRTDFTHSFIWPVKGRISGLYGSQRILNGKPKRPHYGVDIAVPTGTPVKAPAGGVVSLIHPDMFYSGGTLILDHGHGISSTFLHLSRILVREGAFVKQGEVIAEVGATGRATGPHLDWRMNWFNERIDPTLLVPEMSAAR
jgi:murein DD-endopeptidase MepM/ murein hydrolase activator NlpD